MGPLLGVLAGGALGTALRLALDLALPHTDAQPPVSTLVINIIGAFALGVLTSRVWPSAAPWLRALLGPGLLGSFTTFSAFAVSVVALGSSGNWSLAALYLLATVVLGVAAAWAGLRLGRRPSRGREARA
jgi:CrcB protein